MASVYLETSFVSACVTDRADPSSLHRKRLSLEWWEHQRNRHELFVSTEVLAELTRPTFRRSAQAIAFIDGVPIIQVDDEINALAGVFVDHKVMPAPTGGDATHVAICCALEIGYMLSWNVRHLANPNKVEHLRALCWRLGLVPPTIMTPEGFWEPDDA